MKSQFSVIIVVIAMAIVVQTDYAAPVASGYIYRRDNNGPASLIQLGAVPYQHGFAPLPAQDEPIAYNPVPLPYAAAPVNEFEDDDDSDESDEYLDGNDSNRHDYENGGGSENDEKHHVDQGEKDNEGYNSGDYHNKGESGKYDKEHDEGFYNEGEGEKKGYHDEADAHDDHYEAGNSYKGGDHGHKEHFSKGEDVTGYHKLFNKDEFKKDHHFYDKANNDGHFNKHGYSNTEFGSQEGSHEVGGSHDSGFNTGDFGKTGFNDKGHFDVNNGGYANEHGQESHYNNEEDFGKKGQSNYEKGFGYGDHDSDDE